MEILKEIQIKMGEERNQTRRVGRSNYLLVCVQRHLLDKRKKSPMNVFSNSVKVRDYTKRFQNGHWSFLGHGDEESGYETHTYKPEGQWNRTADVMESNSEDSGHIQFTEHSVRWIEES